MAPKIGRPSKYTEDMKTQAVKLAVCGWTDVQIADFFGIAESTFHIYKKKHSDFSESLSNAKSLADAEVEYSLYEKACGYSHEDVHISNFQGDITLTPITKHYPPDTAAAKHWLNNRQKDRWRDKQTTEHTGLNEGPIQISVDPDLVKQAMQEIEDDC
jgi:hypothetical protein